MYDAYLVEPLAEVLSSLGVKRGMVVYGNDKMDEISASAPTLICEINNGFFRKYTISPWEFGLETCGKDELVGGTPEENAAITRAILAGEECGPKRTAVLMNAGAAIYIAGKVDTLADGIAKAAELIDSGAAAAKLEAYIEESNK